MSAISGPLAFFYSTQKEITETEVATLTFTLPDWVEGTYLRTGPGFYDFNNGEPFSVHHFLDGYALLSRFKIQCNQVSYDSKYLQTDSYRKAKMAGKPVVQEFGTKPSPDPTKNLFTRFIPSLIPEMTDNCNVSIFRIQKDLYATADTCFFREIDPEDLTCGEKFDTSKLFGLNMWSAHPLHDEAENFIYNIGTSFLTGLKYNLVKIPAKSGKSAFKQAKIVCSIPSRSSTCASICHSFGMTKNYIVFVEQPAVIVGQRVLASVIHKSCNKDYLDWRPEMKNRFYVINKKDGNVVKTEFLSSDPFLCLHFINCYETKENEVVVDLIGFPNMNCVHISLHDCRNGNEGPPEDLATAFRFVLPLQDVSEVTDGSNFVRLSSTVATAVRTNKHVVVTPDALTQPGIEVPRVHPNFEGKEYTVFYGGGPRTVGYYRNALCKVNVKTKKEIMYRLEEYEYLGEPMFIPNPNGGSDDDGIIISAVSVAKEGSKCYLVFLDGKTMEELGRAEFTNFIPMAAHGIFLPKNNN